MLAVKLEFIAQVKGTEQTHLPRPPGYYTDGSPTAGRNGPEAARKTVDADAKNIVVTSGTTESNYRAIKGLARFYKQNHIITLRTLQGCNRIM